VNSSGVSTVTSLNSTNATITNINSSGISTVSRLNVGTGGTVITTTAGGLVGIGTDNPQEKLEIEEGNIRLSTDASGGVPKYAINWTGGGAGQVAVFSANTSTGEVRMGADNSSGTYFTTLYSNGAERLRIDSSGRVTLPYQPAVNYYIQVNTGTGVRTFTSKRTRGSTGLSSVAAGDGSNHGSVGRFTAPVSGVYLFTCSSRGTPPSSNNELLSVYGSWSTGTNTLNPANELLDTRGASIGNDGFGTTFTLYLSANDYWELDWYRPAPTSYLGTTLWDISILLIG
jgi:hypothetical protein